FEREHYAVGRGAVDLPPALSASHRVKRVVQRERVAGRALLAIGRDDRDLTERFRGGDQTLDPLREKSVVVGDEQTHRGVQSARASESRSVTRSRRSISSDSSASTVSAPRAMILRSPLLRCSSTFCRAPSIVYFSSYNRCFTSITSSTSRRW